ncbi:ABC transporter substrate-binding protein [Luteococcus sp. H138]|uniref:ABC transporter substrate-binding protein n=1 Tax=unclassified Luteococcus TaxID=2639923 RepID=UPI00313D8C2E
MKSTSVRIAAFATIGVLALGACGSTGESTDASKASGGSTVASAKVAKATSLKDIGTMADLEAAAKAEGQLNVIALPHDWSNYGEVIETFKKKYPEITVNEANPNASSKEEIDAIKTNKGTDKAPDTVDVGAGVANEYADQFAPYKVEAWDAIPAEVKDPEGRFTADYTGIMSLGYNKTKYGEINSFDQLTDPKFKSTVALNGKPAEAGAAFNGFLSANLGNGGTLENLQPGLDYFKKLKDAGTLTTVDISNATVDSGQTGVVFDWSYNQQSTKDRLAKQGVEWEYKVLPGAEVASYYNQAINADAPHPAAARLWQEYLYSPEAQNLWMKGGATPVLLEKMKADKTVDEAALATQVKTTKTPATYTSADSKRITAWLAANWDKTIGN